MKKIFTLVFVLCLFISSSLADRILYDPYADMPAEQALTEYAASVLEKELGEKVEIQHTSGIIEAVNLFLADPYPDNAILIVSQEAMILSLQGYTAADLRQAVIPVTCIAASGSMFFASPAVKEALSECIPEALAEYTEEHAYEIFAARMLDASHMDYLTVRGTEDLYVDENLYTDFDEAAGTAEMDLIVMSTAMIPESAACYIPLFEADLPGVWQGVFIRSEAVSGTSETVSDILSALISDGEYIGLKEAAGYTEECPADFAGTVRDLFADYVRYLTNQGLFFYESTLRSADHAC